jgi:hypothetical protein
MKKVLIITLALVFGLLSGFLYFNQTDTQSFELDAIRAQISELSQKIASIDIPEISLGAFNPAGGLTYRLQTSAGTTDTTINKNNMRQNICNRLCCTSPFADRSAFIGAISGSVTTYSAITVLINI